MFKRILELKQAAAANDYQHQENNIINEIKSDLSRDSSHRAKQNAAIKYSDWFYNQHGHDYSLNNQKTCAQKTIDIVGIDVNTAVEIQYRVIRAYEIAEGILNARETIQQHHLTASSLINQQLTSQVQNLSINTPQVPASESINSRYGGKVVGTSQVGVDQEGTSLAVSKAISDAQAFPNYNNSYNSLGDTRAINLASSGVKDSDLSKFCAVINSYTFNLEALYLNNNAIGNNGIAELIPAIKGSKYTMYRQFENGQSVYPPRIVAEDLRFLNYKYDPSNPKFITQNVVFLNLCNNNIGDRGAKTLADALKSGELQSTKSIDVSGNNITKTGEGALIKALKHPITQSVMIAVQRTLDLKTMISGSKEEKQAIIKETLQTAQNNGVDVKNIAVSKGLWESIKNGAKLTFKFGWGFTKCNIVPEDSTSLAADVITAKMSKKAFAVTSGIDAVVCLFDTAAEVSTSAEGVQFIRDLDLCGANSVIDSIE